MNEKSSEINQLEIELIKILTDPITWINLEPFRLQNPHRARRQPVQHAGPAHRHRDGVLVAHQKQSDGGPSERNARLCVGAMDPETEPDDGNAATGGWQQHRVPTVHDGRVDDGRVPARARPHRVPRAASPAKAAGASGEAVRPAADVQRV